MSRYTRVLDAWVEEQGKAERLHALLMAWWRSGRHIPESDYEQMLLRRLSVGHWFVGCSIRYVFLFLSLRLHGWVCKLITITTD